MGSFCNFDYTISGFCESCEGLESDQDCDSAGLITEEGRTECKLFCAMTTTSTVATTTIGEYLIAD